MDIVINFFLQELDVGHISKREELSTIASRYFYGDFSYDLIAFLPFGLLGQLSQQLELLWVIKALRVKTLNYYMGNSKLLKVVKDIVSYVQARALENE